MINYDDFGNPIFLPGDPTLQEKCDHGVAFDEDEARKMLSSAPPIKTAADFIIGNPASAEVKRRWPRGWFTADKPCAKCGYVGIAYASFSHYTMGDW